METQMMEDEKKAKSAEDIINDATGKTPAEDVTSEAGAEAEDTTEDPKA